MGQKGGRTVGQTNGSQHCLVSATVGWGYIADGAKFVVPKQRMALTEFSPNYRPAKKSQEHTLSSNVVT